MLCLVTVLLRYLPLVKQCCDPDEEAGDDAETRCRCRYV
jgi:hypothetical protein